MSQSAFQTGDLDLDLDLDGLTGLEIYKIFVSTF